MHAVNEPECTVYHEVLRYCVVTFHPCLGQGGGGVVGGEDLLQNEHAAALIMSHMSRTISFKHS